MQSSYFPLCIFGVPAVGVGLEVGAIALFRCRFSGALPVQFLPAFLEIRTSFLPLRVYFQRFCQRLAGGGKISVLKEGPAFGEKRGVVIYRSLFLLLLLKLRRERRFLAG